MLKTKFLLIALALGGSAYLIKNKVERNNELERLNLISELSSRVLTDEKISNFNFKNKKVSAEFFFNEKLEKYIKRQMRIYTSKAMAVVVLDNSTGEVISLLTYTKESKTFGRSMALIASHPSASLAKIISAADLIENAGYGPRTNLKTRGKGTTLYKYQLKKDLKWSRNITLGKAFAYSNNSAFGKAVIDDSSAGSLYKMALNFGFNKEISNILSLPRAIFRMPSSQFNLAEMASGFNRETMISPLHAAIFVSIIANDGILKRPKLLKSLLYDGENLLEGKNEKVKKDKKVLNSETAVSLSKLMTKTVTHGTARKSFRRLRKNLKKKLEIGGKTGSITGGIPEGKRDWFAAYSRPKDKSSSGISVSVMSIQGELWRAKSSYLAKNIIEYYYNKIKKIEVTTDKVFAKN